MKRSLTLSLALVPAGVTVVLLAGPAGAATYSNCTEARQAGATDIRKGMDGYSSSLDEDNDGVACESSTGEDAGASTSDSSTSSSSAGSTDDSSSSGSSGGGSGSVSVNSGSGGQAGAASSALPLAVGGLGVLVIGGSAVAARRQKIVARRG